MPADKGNDYGIEALKQLITLASAIFALTVTFLKDILGDASGDAAGIWLIYMAWGCLLFVVGRGWVAMASAAKVVGNAPAATYAFGDDLFPRKAARQAQWTFLLALVALGVFGVWNSRLMFRHKDDKVPEAIARELAGLRSSLSNEGAQRAADVRAKLAQLEAEQRRITASLDSIRASTAKSANKNGKSSKKR